MYMYKSLNEYPSLQSLKQDIRNSYRKSLLNQSDFLKSEHLNPKSLFSNLQDEFDIITNYLEMPEKILIQDITNKLISLDFNGIKNQYKLKIFNKYDNKLLFVAKKPNISDDNINIEFAKGIINYLNINIGNLFNLYKDLLKDLLKYKKDKLLLKKKRINDLYDLKYRMNNSSFSLMKDSSNFDEFIKRFILYVLVPNKRIIEIFILEIQKLDNLLYYKQYQELKFNIKNINIKKVIKSMDFLNTLNIYVNPKIIEYINRFIKQYNKYIKLNISNKSLVKLSPLQNRAIRKTNSYNHPMNSRKYVNSRTTRKVKTI